MTRAEIVTQIQETMKDPDGDTWSTGVVDVWAKEGIEFLASTLVPDILKTLQSIETICATADVDYITLPSGYLQPKLLVIDDIPVESIDLEELRKIANVVVSPDTKNKFGYIWGTKYYFKPAPTANANGNIDFYYIRKPVTSEATPELPTYLHYLIVDYGVWKGLLSDGEFEKAKSKIDLITQMIGVYNAKYLNQISADKNPKRE